MAADRRQTPYILGGFFCITRVEYLAAMIAMVVGGGGGGEGGRGGGEEGVGQRRVLYLLIGMLH